MPRRFPDSITVGGRNLELSMHIRRSPHPGITGGRIAYVLEHWSIRGNCIDTRGSRTWTYWGFVPGLDKLVKVAVSLDGERIVAAYQDRTATNNWNQGARSYFETRCGELEEGNADNRDL